MKRCFSLILCLLCFVISQKNPVSAMQKPDFLLKRACWISYLDIEQYLKDLDENSFRTEVARMYDIMLQHGLNTAIVHVRAFGDAIYPSDIFPSAAFLSSNQTGLSYDALEIMLEIAHEKGISFEAWINPYRLSKDNLTTNHYKQTVFFEANNAYIVEYTNSSGETALSLDPALEESRDIIVAGIKEILESYDVDGIHFDDYFYIDGMGDNLSEQEKKSNVNKLLLEVHKCTSSYHVPFGISPAGNVDYAKSIGADIETWLLESDYIDYIMPQLYWSNSYEINDETVALYKERCEQWKQLNARNLPIYTGLGLYRVGEIDEFDQGWSLYETNLKEQWEYANELGYEGYCLFRYSWLEQTCSINELENLNACFDQKTSDNREDSKAVSFEKQDLFDEQKNMSRILVRLYKKDGTICELKRPCHSFTIDCDDVMDITITYLNESNESCMAFYRTKCKNGIWNRWVLDGEFTNFEQFCTINEVEIMRIPHKTVKNTCFFVDWCYNNY